MKGVIELYMCDSCGGEVAKYPYDPQGELPEGNAYYDGFGLNYQTLLVNGKLTILCGNCCSAIKKAVELGLVTETHILREDSQE